MHIFQLIMWVGRLGRSERGCLRECSFLGLATPSNRFGADVVGRL